MSVAMDGRHRKAMAELPQLQATATVTKVQVLGLEPIKAKLGSRWSRLSELVHTLFEKSLARAQSPTDRFIRLDELSYAATFQNLPLAETKLVCLSIATEVCELLFGNEAGEVSVRGLVGEIVGTLPQDVEAIRHCIDATLDRVDTEIIIARSSPSGTSLVWESQSGQSAAQAARGAIEAAHSLLATKGRRMGLFPVWNLSKRQSTRLFMAPYRGTPGQVEVSGRRALDSLDERQVVDLEVVMLEAAVAFSQRVHASGKLAAIGVGVSYSTLAGLQTRVRYLKAVHNARIPDDCPLVVKLERVPAGVPLGRLSDLVGLLKCPQARVTLGFDQILTMPKIDIRIGASGIGGSLPTGTDDKICKLLADTLIRQTGSQRVFTFLDGLDTENLVRAARGAGVHFGRGRALGSRHLSGLEQVPDFPLTPEHWR
jgi:hypothetical protein